MFRYLFMVLVCLAACESSRIHVRASIPSLEGEDAPVANLPLVALPYNRDSILQVLESAGTPRPRTRELDSLFAIWRRPFAEYARSSVRVMRLRDSLAGLHRQLDSLPRNSPQYQSLYLRFASLTDSMEAARLRGEPARKELDKLRASVFPRIDSLRREVTTWENSTFRNYDSIVKRLAENQQPLADTTGADGTADLKVGPGRWWIYAWSWDEGDPYSRWYWNVPVNGDSVILDARSGQKRPRY
ncbi:MAG: hypothetical protein ABI679_08385 [Gemmatimonadota bacterium]